MNKIIRTSTFVIQRCISTTNTNSKNTFREGRFMGKLVQKDSKHSRKWYNFSPVKSEKFNVDNYGPSRGVQRRMTVLNKLFMGHITDILSTGEISSKLFNRGIEITHVEVTANFSFVHVYWIDKGLNPEYTLETQELLNNCAYLLRHKLIELHVMSIVPKIQFVRDKHHNITKQVEYLLSIADYGPDLKSSPLVPLEEEKEGQTLSSAEPSMRNDVFGIDHTRIMSKIKASLKLARNAAARDKPMSPSVNTSNTSLCSNGTNIIDQADHKLLLTEFIKQKKADERRKYNEMKKTDRIKAKATYEMDDNEYDNFYEKDDYNIADEYDDCSDYDQHDTHENDYRDDHEDHKTKQR